jgi:mRNA deadenylase 3'-5' endonuclease subunit Ccr4
MSNANLHVFFENLQRYGKNFYDSSTILRLSILTYNILQQCKKFDQVVRHARQKSNPITD